MVLGLLRWLLTVALLVALAVWLARNPGAVSVQWLGWRADTNVPFLLVLLGVFGIISLWLYGIFRRILRLPSTVGGWMERRRLGGGVEALGHGYAAMLAGDSAGLRRAAHAARRALRDDPSALFLSARVAEAVGDHAAAGTILAGLLDVPEMRPAALKSLAMMAGRSGHPAEQRRLAQEAFDLNPRLDWVVPLLLECQVRDGDWEEAVATVTIGRKVGVLEADRARRLEAAVRAACAEEFLERGDTAAAVRNARKAVQADRRFLPAVLAMVEALGRKGALGKASSLVHDTWPDLAHPALAKVFLNLYANETDLQCVARVKKLADRAPSHPESRLLLASVSLKARLWGQARSALEALLKAGAEDPRGASLMASVEEQESGNPVEVASWLRRAAQWAADASPDRSPVSARSWLVSGISGLVHAPVSTAVAALPAPMSTDS